MPPGTDAFAAFIGGFVVAEGTFVRSGTPPKFAFAVGLGAKDSETCLMLQRYFGVGSIARYSRRKPHYDDECAFAIQSLVDHVEVTVPFMDAHLPQSYKREQYLRWRRRLIDYWEHDTKRVRPCITAGCEKPRRAHGLCRTHLYAARGV